MVSGPKAPDPNQTAQAQSEWNIHTGMAQQAMNMVNQNTPWGSLGYDATGTQTIMGPNGQPVEVPQYTANVTLSPQQQAIFDQAQTAQSNLAGLAADQSAAMRQYLQGGLDLSGLPALATSAGQSADIGGGFNTQFNGDLGLQTQLGPDFNAVFNGSLDPNFNTQFNSDLGPDYRTNVDLATSYAGADDFSADRQRVEDALWQRTAGDRQQQEERLRTQLINRGLQEGSAAWNSEYDRLSRAENDLRMATILAGGQEQQRMVDMARDAAMFGNQSALAGAQFGNQAALAQGQFGHQAQQLGNDAALAQGQFGQNAQQLQNAAALAQGNFFNNAALAQGQFGSQQQQLQNQSALAQAQFGNQARMDAAQFQNAARGQGFQEALAQRNQPLNELSALLSGSQVSMPQFAGTPQTGVAGVDYTGLINNQFQHQNQQHNAAMGGLFGLGSALIGALPFSDERLKTNIRRVGETEGGTPIYTYNYIWGGPTMMGVMAQDVPEAAEVDASGYYVVDYRKVH